MLAETRKHGTQTSLRPCHPAVRERGTDGAYIFVGQFGEARVVHPTTGQIYGGKYDPTRNGFQFGRNGITPNYDNLTLK